MAEQNWLYVYWKLERASLDYGGTLVVVKLTSRFLENTIPNVVCFANCPLTDSPGFALRAPKMKTSLQHFLNWDNCFHLAIQGTIELATYSLHTRIIYKLFCIRKGPTGGHTSTLA